MDKVETMAKSSKKFQKKQIAREHILYQIQYSIAIQLTLAVFYCILLSKRRG